MNNPCLSGGVGISDYYDAEEWRRVHHTEIQEGHYTVGPLARESVLGRARVTSLACPYCYHPMRFFQTRQDDRVRRIAVLVGPECDGWQAAVATPIPVGYLVYFCDPCSARFTSPGLDIA